MSKKLIIDKVLENNLCSVCGTCIGVCPKNCIAVNANGNAVEINRNICVECNICAKSCPSLQMCFSEKKDAIDCNYDEDIGRYKFLFKGCANDSSVRKNGASGGMITALCAYLLDNKIVDCVLSACFSEKKSGYQLVTKSEDLYKNQKSFYIPIPLNAALREIKNSNLRYAVVGTPCQLQGMTFAIKANQGIKCKIAIKIGLFCGYVQEPAAIDYYAKYLGCDDGHWRFSGWRAGDYPGYVAFENSITKEVRRIIYYDSLALGVPFFSLKKCFLCPDGTNDAADIAFGDVHSYGNDENIGILRNPNVLEYLEGAKKDGYLSFDTSNQDALYANASTVVGAKRRVAFEQIDMLLRKKQHLPDYKGLKMKNRNIILRVFWKKKARLYYKLWNKENRDLLLDKKSPQQIFSKGKYIYNYPQASFFYRIICKIAVMMKR